MIRVAIVAKSAHAAEELVSALAGEDLLEMVDIQISPRHISLSRHPVCDVLLTVALTESETLSDGLPVVAITNARLKGFPGPHSARAVLPMTARTDEIVAALIAAASGLFVLTADQAVTPAREPVVHETTGVRPEKLTVRELEVLRMLADGLANKEIANALGVSDHTVKFHVSQILAKLNAASRTEAVTAGIRSGLLAI